MRAIVVGLLLSAVSAFAQPFRFGFTDDTGMSVPCSCTDISLLDGRKFSFSRNAPSYCTRGNEVDHINDGDLVLCPPNKPRVMRGGDGTRALGVSIWDTRINGAWFSQEFERWNTGGTAALPVITPNVALAPDLHLTADRVDFPATSGTNSYVYQHHCAIDYDLRTLYLRGVPPDDGGVATGTFEIASGTGSTPTNGSGTCNWSSAYTTRCGEWDSTGADIGGYFIFGPLTDHPAQSVYVWQADCVNNSSLASFPYPPPIYTTDGGAQMPAEILEVSLVSPVQSDLQMGFQFTSENGDAGDGVLVSLNSHSGVSWYLAKRHGGLLQCESNNANAITTVSLDGGTNGALFCGYDGDQTLSTCRNGCCVSGQLDAGIPSQFFLTIGSNWNGFEYANFANGVVSSLSGFGSSTKTIGLFGDSIVEAFTAVPGQQPQDLIHNFLGNGVAVQNFGHSGDLSNQCRARWESQLGYVRDAGTGSRTYWMIQCGTNGASDAGGTVGDLEAMLVEGADAGIHVLWSTITPSGNSASIAVINSTLGTFVTAHGYRFADTFSALQYPADSGFLNPIYGYGDDLHLNSIGTSVETQLWIRAGKWMTP